MNLPRSFQADIGNEESEVRDLENPIAAGIPITELIEDDRLTVCVGFEIEPDRPRFATGEKRNVDQGGDRH